MSRGNNDSYYARPAEALEQGDMFHLELVAPAADEVQRIFRAKDGRHGSVVFEENCDALVFNRLDLDTLLESVSVTPLHTKPFRKTPDGHEEMVVVYSRLLRYFIIATQTCDICGIDKAPFEWATILPVITLADFCSSEPLPFLSTHQTITIHEFVSAYCEESNALEGATDMEYAAIVRQMVAGLAESGYPKKVRKDAKYLKKYLQEYFDRMYMFLLPADPNFELPESYVDFTSAFTVPTGKLLAIKDSRFAKITDPYRVSFAQKFGTFFARVALPRPMRPT